MLLISLLVTVADLATSVAAVPSFELCDDVNSGHLMVDRNLRCLASAAHDGR